MAHGSPRVADKPFSMRALLDDGEMEGNGRRRQRDREHACCCYRYGGCTEHEPPAPLPRASSDDAALQALCLLLRAAHTPALQAAGQQQKAATQPTQRMVPPDAITVSRHVLYNNKKGQGLQPPTPASVTPPPPPGTPGQNTSTLKQQAGSAGVCMCDWRGRVRGIHDCGGMHCQQWCAAQPHNK